MLNSLFIQNFVLIDNLDIRFDKGFSVITGETGAGKSIILGALSLVLGQRADGKSIKKGSDKCVIEATFDISKYQLEPFFLENDLEYDAQGCILRRELFSSGKSRAFVNDSPVSLSILKELGTRLIDIHSQHQNLLLGDNHFQLRVVDVMAENEILLILYKKEYSRYQSLKRELKELQQKAAQTKQEEDYIRFQLDQLTEAALTADEQILLEQEQETLSHAEEIKGSLRKKTELIPEEAFREAIANALVHRTWDINTHINVAMYNDKIEISSPGGLPKGVSEEVYKNGGISIPRNPIIASIFFQLHLIERFGTGIRRINEAYRENEKKPIYTIFNDMIQITLPVLQEQNNLSDDENSVFSALKNSTLSTSDISKATQFSKSKVLSIIKKLVEQGYIVKKGSGRGTKYTTL